MPVELKVPSVGESINEVFIATWLKKPGDAVEADEPVVEVETDKATLEVPAGTSGVLQEILKEEGEAAEVGEVIARIAEGEGAAAAPSGGGAEGQAGGKGEPEPEPEPESKPGTEGETKSGAKADAQAGEKPAATGGHGHVMPAAQRLLDEHGIDASEVRGSGPGGRILKEDVQKHVESGNGAAKAGAAKGAAPAKEERRAPAAPAGEREEVVPMSPLRRTIARRLVEAQQTAALLTTFNEIDMSGVMALREEHKDAFEKRYGVRLGFMAFFVKAAVDALKAIPQLNAEIREQSIVFKDHYDISVAVSTPKGLVTPVVRDADRLSFAQIEETIGDFGRRARDNKIKPEELQGGTFTISNGGVFGSLMSTPIVNPPQSGVLGMHAIQERPVAVDGQVVIRPMMYVALTYDHRIVDGREAVTFLKRIKDGVESPARLLIEV